ncbi:hypothetical protein like AT5G66440 [Hibiscus trionum]|uniref:DUF4408 domain-containing protein n=1 Tax=Hibiscus trionum TaxID=183268 RepID=A0A9W7IKL6_HIBTR|nr:hypothetical protein like AT5G66440 [Hibiscus trionum]
MGSFDFENVKAEKEDAVWRYNMERMLRNGLRFIGFSFVLLLLSCLGFPTLIPNTIQVVGNFRRRFITSFNHPLFNFAVVNIIVVVVYVLSCQKQAQNQPTSHDIDIYHEYVSSCRNIPTVVPATEETLVDKKVVLVENAVVLSQVKVKQQCGSSSIVETITETKRSLSPVKHKKPEYRRTRSMVSEYRSRRVPGEFRRWDTEPARKSMDEMSSEEFRSIIDSFIAEKKKSLMLENTRRKDNCVSIVVN